MRNPQKSVQERASISPGGIDAIDSHNTHRPKHTKRNATVSTTTPFTPSTSGKNSRPREGPGSLELERSPTACIPRTPLASPTKLKQGYLKTTKKSPPSWFDPFLELSTNFLADDPSVCFSKNHHESVTRTFSCRRLCLPHLGVGLSNVLSRTHAPSRGSSPEPLEGNPTASPMP